MHDQETDHSVSDDSSLTLQDDEEDVPFMQKIDERKAPFMHDEESIRLTRGERRQFMRRVAKRLGVGFFVCLICLTLGFAWMAVLVVDPLELLRSTAAVAGFEIGGGGWGGWDELEHMFVFGDSYSDQGFDPFKTQPHAANPFGNPDWLLPLSSGSNWVHFLTLTHNTTAFSTYSLAIGGSTVDPSLVTPFFNNTHASFSAQHVQRFRPLYANPSSNSAIAPWKPRNTLFAVWFGINDITLSCGGENGQPTEIERILTSYRQRLEELHAEGARNFLLLNVPPFYRNFLDDPMHRQPGAALMVADTLEWNRRLVGVRDEFVAANGDAKVWLFDAWRLYEDVLADPQGMAETEGLGVLKGVCDGYVQGTMRYDQLDKECVLPVNRWFWLNEMHPTYSVHNATAARIVGDCFEAGRKGYCS